MNHFNGLSPSEAERLALLLEECGEIQQCIGKILRHGYEESHPDKGSPTNRASLQREIGDVLAAVDMMVSAGDLNGSAIDRHWTEKLLRVAQYLHHQK